MAISQQFSVNIAKENITSGDLSDQAKTKKDDMYINCLNISFGGHLGGSVG